MVTEKNFFEDQDREPGGARNSQQQPDRAEHLDWTGRITREKFHRHQIEKSPDDPARPVFRGAAATKPKINLQLGDLRALLRRDRRHEAMHLTIEREAACEAAAIR